MNGARECEVKVGLRELSESSLLLHKRSVSNNAATSSGKLYRIPLDGQNRAIRVDDNPSSGLLRWAWRAQPSGSKQETYLFVETNHPVRNLILSELPSPPEAVRMRLSHFQRQLLHIQGYIPRLREEILRIEGLKARIGELVGSSLFPKDANKRLRLRSDQGVLQVTCSGYD